MNGLGYQQFCAQGGDIGAGVSSWLAYRFPQQLKSFHLNFVPASYRPFLGDKQKPVTQEEQTYLDGVPVWAAAEGAYAHMQSTKSQTLAYALTDSPIGLAAWIVEKFRSWSDCDGDVLSVFSMDSLLTDICLYWFSGTLDASLRLYKETRLRPLMLKAGERITPPLGVAHFPKELLTPPRSWVERGFNVTHWSDMPKGGHFAAMEQPERLAQDIRAHFRAVR
jgi:pimeloyl-ACP methyl ester carboxylesterase